MSKSLKKLIDINRLREFKNKLVGTDSAYVQTGAVDQTVGGTKTFSKPIVGSVTGSSGSCTGNAATATRANSAASADTATNATNATNSNAANQLQAFVNDDFTSGNHYVKAIRSSLGWSTHLWMCYNNGAKMADEVSVNYADFAGSATKLATARTIALSGAATGTATAFDGSSNITIPVTALASSAIRAQWYAAFPDGAEAHNSMWGGRDITAAFNNGTVSANIANGTFKDIFPGDYITKQVTISGTTYTVNWVIADCDYWINKGDDPGETTTHHVAIVPQTPIFSANMNATNTTEGGYAGSEMYKNIILACATGIVNAFGSSHILTFRDSITKAVNASSISSGAPIWTGASSDEDWYSQQCNLMCERMVYGMPVFSSSALDAGAATRQFSAFRLSEKLINYNRQWWWLRDVASSMFFAFVRGDGIADAGVASYVRGVRPFALLV